MLGHVRIQTADVFVEQREEGDGHLVEEVALVGGMAADADGEERNPETQAIIWGRRRVRVHIHHRRLQREVAREG